MEKVGLMMKSHDLGEFTKREKWTQITPMKTPKAKGSTFSGCLRRE
jgi:hypothetical protein